MLAIERGGGTIPVFVAHVAEAPSTGSVDVRMVPKTPFATRHSVVVGQATSTSLLVPATFLTVHVADAPSLGSVLVSTLPWSSVAMHSVVAGQLMPNRGFVPTAATW